MNRDPVRGLTIKAALLLGFGLTLGVWLFAGYGFTRKIAQVQTDAASINSRYMRTQLLLSGIRAQVLLGSVFVRDALLDPDAAHVPNYQADLQKALLRIDDQLQRYVPVVDSAEERARVGELRRELDDFRATMLGVLASIHQSGSGSARLPLSRRVVAKRDVVIRVSEQVQELNRAAFVQRQTQTAAMSGETQRRLWEQLGFAVVGSLGIALLASAYAGRLEQRLRRQQARDLQLTRDLQRLSAKLVEAQEEERRAISRELHDEVGQALTALRMELDAAQRKLQGRAEDAGQLNEAQAIAEATLNNVRNLSRLLHPSLLDDLGLPAALESYLRGFESRNGICVELHVAGMTDRLAAATEAAIYRIVQEAATNVTKHAKATCCRVSLVRRGDAAVLAIEDDGAGFTWELATAPDSSRGLGLIGIRERVAQLGGSFVIDSAPGQGTRLAITIPVHSRTRVLRSELEPSTTIAERVAAGDAVRG